MTPLKRPLATSTKVNVANTPPKQSPKKTYTNKDDVVATEDSPKRRSGRKSQKKAAPSNSTAEGGRKASGRVTRRSANRNREPEGETDEEEQARLTREALAKLDDACARAAKNDDLECSVWSDVEVVDVTTPSGSKSKRLSVDDLVLVKIRWKYGNIVRTEINKVRIIFCMFSKNSWDKKLLFFKL